MSGKLKIVISDFHIADGQESGFLNPWENFHHDAKLAELLRYYSTDYYEDEEVELIINGDFFDLLQVRYDGGFPDEITEEIGVAKLKSCLDGHPMVVGALTDFIEVPKKRITVLPGNHDFELVFPACRRVFCEAVCGAPEDERFRFVVDKSYYEFDGVQIHHGMQFEAMNRFNWKRLFLTRGRATPILNLPWGSVYLLRVLNKLKEQRPHVDRVQPFSLFLIGSIFFDTIFAMKIIAMSLHVFFVTRILALFKRPREVSLWSTFQLLFEYEAFPSFENKIKKLMRRTPHIHTVILGHTHLAKVRRFGRNRTYVNTGTWTDLISLDIARPGLSRELTYATIEYPEGQPPQTSLKAWRGYHDLWREIHY
jgi:UDP-2,3-diacylglucosamine pyrophosphatase LpxH